MDTSNRAARSSLASIIKDFVGLKTPQLKREHDNTQSMHPAQRSSLLAIFLFIFTILEFLKVIRAYGEDFVCKGTS
jgi:hypothetical protein